MQKGIVVASVVAIAALVGAHSANADDTIKIGTFATLEGTYTALGEDGMRGFDLAVMQHKGNGWRQEARDHQRLIGRLARFGAARRQKAGRAE